MENEVNGVASNTAVTRRRVISGIAGAGAAVLVGTTLARAQDSTPTTGTGTDSTTDTEDTISPDEQMATQYQLFLTKLAAALSISDTATLDAGIRTALKAMVDDELAAGDIAANDATDEKTEIDDAVAPISPRGGGRGHGGGMRGQFGNGSGPKGAGGGKPGNNNDMNDDDTSEATPTA